MTALEPLLMGPNCGPAKRSVTTLALKICDALEYLDGHHDLDPEKIMVDGEEGIKVLGPATASQVGCALLSHRPVAGTPDESLRHALAS